MLKRVPIFNLKVRLFREDGTSYISSFLVHADDYIVARSVLETYLNENKADTLLKYDRVDCIWNEGSEYVVMDVGENQEQETPQPLTLEQLEKRIGKPVCTVTKEIYRKGKEPFNWTILQRVSDDFIYHAYGVIRYDCADFYDYEPVKN